MGSSPTLRTHQATIVADSDFRIVLRFLPKERNSSVQEPLNEVQDEYEDQVPKIRDSLDSFNARGCDEIMCQFMKDIDLPCDIDIEVDIEEKNIGPNNHSSIIDLETII